MKTFVGFVVASCAIAICLAQNGESNGAAAAGSPPAAAADVEALRQQVQALTEMVQQLQQQVKQQQSAAQPAPNADVLPQQAESPAPAETAANPSTPAASAPPLFPTTDSAVIASAPSSSAA